MAWSRTATAAAGILVSLAVSVVAWVAFDVLVLFLFVPLVPFLLGRGDRTEPPERRCPDCGFTTRNPEFAHCPRDGTPLEAETGSASRAREDGQSPSSRSR